jgi:hypothetical protein
MLENRAWGMAKSPLSSIFSTAFMGWMMGNQLSIYTIFFIVFALYNPLKSLLATNAQFLPLQQQSTEGSTFLPQKLVFAFLNFAALCVGLYKAHSMGLVPTFTELIIDSPAMTIPTQISIGIMK